MSAWARSRGFKPSVVSALLAGRTQGNWGEAYHAAIALGLKPGPTNDETHPLEGAPAPSGVGRSEMT